MHPIIIPALFLVIFIILITSSFFINDSKTKDNLVIASFVFAILTVVRVVYIKINQKN